MQRVKGFVAASIGGCFIRPSEHHIRPKFAWTTAISATTAEAFSSDFSALGENLYSLDW